MRTKTLPLCLIALTALALAACAAEDAPTTERGIDQDISATHDASAPTISNLGERDAPWRLDMGP